MEENKTNGYLRKEYQCAVKRYCQTMELRHDDALIAKYREAHDKEHFWDEIKQGIRQVGILEMEIYILANRLVMVVETPQDFDWDSAMKKLASLPRQAEWEAYVSQFQQCSAEATSDAKWQMMERMFHLYD